MRRRIAIGVAMLLIVAGCGEQAVQSISESHVDANVPAQADFDRFMRRDLESYFTASMGKPAAVEYELLRDGPTQAGIAYPKFYVWVKASTSDGSMSQGTARLAAVERKEFQVTHFVAESEIRANPGGLYQVSPGPVCDKIESRLGIGG